MFDYIGDTVGIIPQLTEATAVAYDMTYAPVMWFCAVVASMCLVLMPIMLHFAPIFAEYILTPLFDVCGLTTGKHPLITPDSNLKCLPD